MPRVSPAIPTVFVVDDDISVRDAVGSLIRSAGMKVRSFAAAQAAWNATRDGAPDCMVLDVHLPGINGLEFQERLVNAKFSVPIIFLTGNGDIPTSVRAIKAGAIEFLTKPFKDATLLEAIKAGVANRRKALDPSHEEDADVPPTPSELGPLSGKWKASVALQNVTELCRDLPIVGASPAIKESLARVTLVAQTDSTVLIRGETGTGKELLACALHLQSKRASSPFIAINCGAIPQSLIASELFGHEKGAFTGALNQRVGRFEQAQGGTLFLDEIGELPAETQVMLLRVLQERTFERVGGSELIKANVRVVAATHRDLEAGIAAGSFRSDLFYRLNVFPIEIAPLRERREDIPFLLASYVKKFAFDYGKRVTRISKRSLDMMMLYDWPGNIRELQNVIERSLITCDSEILTVDEKWLKKDASPLKAGDQGFDQELNRRERELIEAALVKSKGRIGGHSGAATALGMPPSTLASKIRTLKIDKNKYRII